MNAEWDRIVNEHVIEKRFSTRTAELVSDYALGCGKTDLMVEMQCERMTEGFALCSLGCILPQQHSQFV